MQKNINYVAGQIIEEYIWFSNENYNALQKMNLNTSVVELVDVFPDLELDIRSNHLRAIKYGECLYFTPYYGGRFHAWNLKENKWEDSIKICEHREIVFRGAFLHKEEIWLIPEKLSNSIIKYNVENKKIFSVGKLSTEIYRDYRLEQGLGIGTISVFNNMLYLAGHNGNSVIQIDCNKEKVIRKYDLGNLSVIGIKVVSDKCCWIWTKQSDRIYRLNLIEESVEELYLGTSRRDDRLPFSNIIEVAENQILILPCYYDKVIKVNTADNAVEMLDFPNGFARSKGTGPLVRDYLIDEKRIYLFPYAASELTYIEFGKNRINQIKAIIPDELNVYQSDLLEIQLRKYFKTGCYSEVGGWTERLPKYLDLVSEGERTETKSEQKNIGALIKLEVVKMLS